MRPQRQEADGLVYVSLAQLMTLEFKARALSFVARQPRASILSGNHASRLRGRGLNFETNCAAINPATTCATSTGAPHCAPANPWCAPLPKNATARP